MLRHYNSCTFKYPDLKLQIKDESSDWTDGTCLPAFEPKQPYSQRIQTKDIGIKSERHKFGSKNRQKLDGRIGRDKENLSLLLNTDAADKCFQTSKSEAEFLQNMSDLQGKKSGEVGMGKRDGVGKSKGRY